MLKTKPFDPANYLFDEEDFELYLADAREFGPEAVADAEVVIARARARMQQGEGTPARSVAEPPPLGFSRD